jgi:hypothetical protein
MTLMTVGFKPDYSRSLHVLTTARAYALLSWIDKAISLIKGIT